MLVSAESDSPVSERLALDLADVEARFTAELLSDLACVNRLVGHIERYRGKMLRPTLVLTSGLAARPEEPTSSEPHRVVATVVEMVHMATLVHDDILDDADRRRGGLTVNQLSGNEAAVMLGDYLISHAYHLCSALDRPAISRVIAEATNVVCEGELLQLANRNNWQLDERTYFEIIRRKTASLCGTCCRLAALLHESPEPIGEALFDYGEKLGVAFQIIDDVLDLTGDPQTVGKTLGRDLEKGKLTLPVIRFLATGGEGDRAEALRLLNRLSDPETAAGQRQAAIAAVRDALHASDAVGYARRWAGRLVQDAKAAVCAALPDSPARALMLEMAEAVLTRRS